MNTVVREAASLLIGLTGIVLLAIGLNQVIDIGSCVSGGSYEVARPCPEGSDTLFWLSFAGAIMWIAGMLVSTRIFTPGAGQVLWVVGFAGGGAAMLIKAFTQSSLPPDAKLGATIAGATFLANGLVLGVVGIVQLVNRRRRPAPPEKRATGGTRHSDPWTRLKGLNDLRSTGALTRAEYDVLKAELDGSPADGNRFTVIRQLAAKRNAGALSTEQFEAAKGRVMRGEQA
ncbi:hypothetical protein OG767_01275 [Micromonospora sp. NBC_01392]|uniref:hypothetical protein n=1 Tax=Micromonospora sp. NBC_01392 TaxID=2903588 RepID=UPI0032561B7B